MFNPPTGLYRRDERCQSKVEDQTVALVLPPMDLLYMASIFEKGGASCMVKDYPFLGGGWEDYKRDLVEFHPDTLVINTTTPTIKSDLVSARLAKEFDKDIIVMAKGGYFFKFDEEILRDYPELDTLFRHEHEFALERMVEGVGLDSIKGITRRIDGRIVKNNDGDCDERLDKLPYPARHLIDNKLYVSPENGQPIIVIQTSKGCPNRCIFCPSGAISRYKIRLRSPHKIMEEIKECIDRYNIRQFLFDADTFTWEKGWVIELCQLIVNEDLKIRWGCNSKVNTIDKERLEWMKRAGCWVVGFGIETGNEEILMRIKKGTTPEQARKAIQLCREAGIKSHAFYIIGLPWETRESLNDTLNFAKELDADYFDFNIVYPLPGTEYWEIASKNNLFNKDDLDNLGYATSPVRTFTLSHRELIEFRKRMLMSLYLRPKYIIRTLANQLPSPQRLARHIYFGAKRLKYLLSS